MLFVVSLHLLGHGGVLVAVEPHTISYFIAYFYYTLAYCGVAIFGIITGFVNYCEKEKINRWKKFFYLWMQVVCYNLLSTITVSLLNDMPVEILSLIKCVFPIATRTYWYFTTYFLLFILMPILNKKVSANSRKQNIFLLIAAWLFMYYSHFLTGFFALSMLVLCYLLGAIIKKYDIQSKIDGNIVWLIYGAMFLLTWLWTVNVKPYNSFFGGVFMRYDSPTIIGMGVCFVLHFAADRRQVIFVKKVALFGSNAFAIYLMNDHPLFRSCFIEDNFEWLATNPLKILVAVPTISIFFVAGCILIDKAREKMFKVLKIERLYEMLFAVYKQSVDFIDEKSEMFLNK